MQVAINLACWLLILVGILPTGNIFQNNVQTFIGQSQQRAETQSTIFTAYSHNAMHGYMVYFKLSGTGQILSIYMLRQGLGCVSYI